MKTLISCIGFVMLAGCAARHPETREFPKACPNGWTFLYTDYQGHPTEQDPPAVCRKKA